MHEHESVRPFVRYSRTLCRYISPIGHILWNMYVIGPCCGLHVLLQRVGFIWLNWIKQHKLNHQTFSFFPIKYFSPHQFSETDCKLTSLLLSVALFAVIPCLWFLSHLFKSLGICEWEPKGFLSMDPAGLQSRVNPHLHPHSVDDATDVFRTRNGTFASRSKLN
jgi:hypothetical protein